MKRITFLTAAFLCLSGLTESPAQDTQSNRNMEELKLTQEWDKTFPKSDKVNHSKVTFVNRYGITLAADLYVPKTTAGGKLPAIAVSGPFGAVKEQSSGLYAQTLAERGFLTIAFDPSFTGESGGQPRSVASPDINTEDFSAAVDYLATRPDVDAGRIGIIGICAGEVLPSMRQPTIRVSRQPWPPPCTISAAVRRTVISMLPTMRTPVIKCVRSSMPSVRKIIAPALIPAP